MSKKISARIGAGTLAVATVVAGLSFGPAAANAAEVTPKASTQEMTGQIILQSGSSWISPDYRTAGAATRYDATVYGSRQSALDNAPLFKITQLSNGYFTAQSVATGSCLGYRAATNSPSYYGLSLGPCSSAVQLRLTDRNFLEVKNYGNISRLGSSGTQVNMLRVDDAYSPLTVSTPEALRPFAGWVQSTDVVGRTADVTGTAAPNSKVILNGTDEVTVGADGKWSYTLLGLKLGAQTVSLEQWENGSRTATASIAVNLQVAPVTASVLFDGTDVHTPATIKGTAEKGASIEIRDAAGNMIKAATADAMSGAWSADLPAPNKGGAQAYTVRQVIGGDNGGEASVTADFGAAVSITSPVNDQVHDGGALRFQGRGVAGGQVELREQGKQGVIGTATVLANGVWTIDAANIAAKKLTFVATQTGKGNNVTTSSVTINPDASGAQQPIVNPIADGSNVIIGTGGTPGATIIVRDKDGNEVGTAIVDPSGNWQVTVPPTLGPGKHDLDIVEVSDGNESDATRVVVDFGAAIVVTTAVANAQGIVTYTGTGAAGAAVEVKGKSGRILATTTVGADGKWTAVSTMALPQGGYKVDAFQTTGIGVKSSSEIAFTVAPSTATPVTFTGPANGSTAYTSTPTFSGKGHPGAKIEVGGTSKVVATTTVNAQGDWSVVSPIDLINGSYILQARQTPNNGAPQTIATNAFQIDASPAAPVVVTGPADGAAVDGPRPVFTGTGAKGATITVKGAVKPLATTTVDANGNWNVPAGIDLGKGGYVLTVHQKAPNGAEMDTTVKFSIR